MSQLKFSNVTRQPRKQRKALYSNPLHLKRKMLHAHLSRELRASMGKRSVLAAKGDSVKILKGRFKGISGKISKVNVKTSFVSVEGAMAKKQNGKETPAKLRPNQFIITEIGAQRKIKQGGKKAKQAAPAKAIAQATKPPAPIAQVATVKA